MRRQSAKALARRFLKKRSAIVADPDRQSFFDIAKEHHLDALYAIAFHRALARACQN
jgi:hypothetical protein